MKLKRHLLIVTTIVLANATQAASIDVNQTFDYTATDAPTTAVVSWSSLTWDPSPATFGAGVTAGIPNGTGSTSGVRNLNLDVNVTLKQIQLYNSDTTVFSSDNGSKVTWDSGAPGVQCDLGRNRHAMGNYAAGRTFTVSPDFILNSDLRVTNWVENRITTFNSNVSGAGKLTLRIVPWIANNTCTLAIGGSAPNIHLGGTTLTISTATINATVNKDAAFGTGPLTLDGGGIVKLNLNGTNQEVAGLVSSGAGAHVLGNATAAAAATLTLTLKDGTTSTYAKGIGSADATFGNNISLVVNKASASAGTGVQVLSGNNPFTGSTTVNGGALRIAGAQALSGSSAVSVAADAAFQYQPVADAPLALPGTLALAGGTGTRFGGAVGAGFTSASISTVGIASATAGNIKVDIAAVPGVSSGPGAYTLISGGAGSTLNGATYSLGTVYNATNFKVGVPTASATAVTTLLTATTPLATAYWKGGFAGSANIWAISDGNSTSNWTTNAAGTVGTGLVPGPATKVVISATGAVNQGSMVLGAPMVIDSLSVPSSSAVSLGANGNSLTIAPASASDGLKIQIGAGATTLAANLVLGAPQTWSNSSSSPLTISGVISGGSGVTFSGPGTVILTGGGNNGYIGGTILSGGTLLLNKTSALGATAGTFTIGSGTTIDNTSGGALTMANQALTLNGNFTFQGSNDLNLGNGAATLGDAAGASRTITVNGGSLAIKGVIGDGVTAKGLTKSGPGTLSLSGASTFTGLTSVQDGTLELLGGVDGSSGIQIGSSGYLVLGNGGYSLAAAQTLSGDGVVVGSIQTPAGTTVAPGVAGVGNLHVTGDMTIGGTLAIEINGSNSDRIGVDGVLDLSQATLNVTALNPSGPALVIASYGTLVGTFLQKGTLPAGYKLDYEYEGYQVALVPGVDSDPFGDWVSNAAFGLAPGDQGRDADPDHDGRSNILEFALNGNPSDSSQNGLSALVLQDTNATTGKELTLVAAVRRGATFTGTGPLTATVDGVTYTVGGSASLANFSSAVDDVSTSDTAPAGTNLADLTGSGWEYHTFRLSNSDGLPNRGFLRIGATSTP